MDLKDFLVGLADLIEVDEELSIETNLKDFEEYDSIAVMSLVAYVFKSFGKQFTARQLNQVDTVESLIELIGRENFSE